MGFSIDQKALARRIRIENPYFRAFIGEFMGSAMMMILGNGVLAQVILGDQNKQAHGTFISISLAWGLAVYMGVFFAGKAGGGHINPAVSLAMAITGKLPWIRFPIYAVGQYLGCFAGSLLVRMVYAEKIWEYANTFDNGTLLVRTTGNIFVSNPHASYTTCFWDQFFETAVFLGCVYAIIDNHNFGVPFWAHPLCVGLSVTVCVSGFALNAGSPVNPARDFGPRVMIAMTGWGSEAFSSDNYYFWIPIVATHLGAIVGAGTYELTIGIHLPDAAAGQKPAVSEDNEESVQLKEFGERHDTVMTKLAGFDLCNDNEN